MSSIPDNSESRRKLEAEINRIESESSNKRVDKPKLPEVKLEEKQYAAPSDEYLAVQAEKGLEDYRKQQIAAIKNDSAAGERQLRSERDAYAEGMQRGIDSVAEVYAAAAQNVDNDVLKRGLARSSIAVNAKSAVEGDRAKSENDVRQEYGKKIAELDAEINSVGAKLDAALNDFNLSYAVKLNDKLEKLKAERDEKARSVLEYNNGIKAQQAKLDADRAKTESELYSAALSQKKAENDLSLLSDEELDRHYKTVFDAMESFLSGLTPLDAKLELKNHPYYREHLNDYYYYALYNKYGR